MILAIDPGNTESGYVLLDKELKPVEKGKIKNEELLLKITEIFFKYGYDVNIAIEMIASYGMAVGVTVFETCLWIGRFIQEIFIKTKKEPTLIYRQDEKINLCGTKKAKDSNIIQALIDRFAPNTPNKGKGTKKEQGWFYGFSKDIWQAYAVGVTYHDIYITKTCK